MIVRRLILSAGVCAVAVGVLACSSSTPPAGNAPAGSTETSAPASTPAAAAKPASVPHACNLLKDADAVAVLGEGASLKRDSESSCTLETPKPLGPSIEVKIEPLSDSWDAGDMMAKFDKSVRKLPDLGDGGYTFMGGSIVFKKGPWEVTVITSTYKGDKSPYEAGRMVADRVAAAM